MKFNKTREFAQYPAKALEDMPNLAIIAVAPAVTGVLASLALNFLQEQGKLSFKLTVGSLVGITILVAAAFYFLEAIAYTTSRTGGASEAHANAANYSNPLTVVGSVVGAGVGLISDSVDAVMGRE